MSVTTTANPIVATTTSYLNDYELHHSTVNEPSAADTNRDTSHVPQPRNWPRDHRRVPAYRPINYDLDQSQRPAGSNTVECAFVSVMLHGVWMNAVVSRCWRKTFGRINDKIFHYEIGGEW
ncbi:hypothetical protein BDV24DRAFT_158922 [Aspergillus arachidicola]|uniref:Uncharacterized protein n=1 Tax=Aspergillus arachidicola TaxID=656916 RepID=A0A2G7G2N9_9EURO|nr:hypothetical protein BDV24DRAFT_158922 [Aspergillus arachidicola]PIG87078.1 hypothetical protein AARAC_004309 [Aspergillus arachidicola]